MISPIVGTGLFAAAFLLGSLPSWLFNLGPVWGETFGWSPTDTERRIRRGFVVPAIFLLPLAGGLSDLWGPKDIAIIGLLIVAIGLTMLAVSQNPQAATTNLLGVATGTAFLAIGTIAWMPTIFGPPQRAVGALNLGFIAISLGWLLGPRLAARLQRWFGLRWTLLAAAAVALLSCGVLTTGDHPAIAVESTGSLFRDLRFWLLIVAAGLYLPVESCLESWSEPFLRDLGDRRSTGSKIFFFWFAYLAARLATFWLVRTGFEPWFLLTCAGVSAMILGNLVGTYGPSTGRVGFWCVGFCYGPLLPGFLGLFEQTFPDRFGLILGVLLSLGTLYNAMLGPVLNRHVLHHTPREAMRVPVVLTLLVAAPLLLVTLLK